MKISLEKPQFLSKIFIRAEFDDKRECCLAVEELLSIAARAEKFKGILIPEERNVIQQFKVMVYITLLFPSDKELVQFMQSEKSRF